VSELLDSPPLKSVIRRVNRNVVVTKVRHFLDDLRGQVQGAAAGMNIPTPGELAERIAAWIAQSESPPLAPVINATGVLLPARFSGAPLAEEAILAAHHLAQGFARLSDNPAAGVEERLIQLTGAEAALVTSNHAAATILALASLAAGREVVIARGEIFELDDGTRTSELIAASGAVLREVGSANKTRPADYAAAIGSGSAALVTIHDGLSAASNVAPETSLADLVALARKHQLPLIQDLGPGGPVDLGRYGIGGQPLAAAVLKEGCDLVLLRGDKLIGGPRCGLLAGKAALIEKIRRHALYPALQAGPLALAALGETLRFYADANLAERSIPLLSLLATPIENLRNRAERLAPQMSAGGALSATVIASEARLTEGPAAGSGLPSCAIALVPQRGTVAALAASLESATPAVVGRVEADRVVLDLKAVLPRQDSQLVAAVEAVAVPTESPPPLPNPID
jgi:L-seryl-tRNA(Ser) seleniumtransferase